LRQQLSKLLSVGGRHEQSPASYVERESAITNPAASTAIESQRSELSQGESQISQVSRNMLYADSSEMVEVFQAELRQLKSQAERFRADLQA